MKYVLDFDRTLFDVDQLYVELEKLGVRHLSGTEESFSYLDVPSLLFADAIPFLMTLPKEDVYLLSSFHGTTANWTESYQSQKITASGIQEYVKEVIVMSGEKGSYVADLVKDFDTDEQIVFVDDQLNQCQSVQSAVPEALCLLIQRTISKKTLVKKSEIIQIATLDEITQYIEGDNI